MTIKAIFKISFFVVFLPLFTFAQAVNNPPTGTSPPSSTAPASSPAATPPSTGPSSSGTFSIEAEIFGYKSLQSDSEAIACDIAAFLYPDETVVTYAYGKNKLLTPPDWTDEDARRYEPIPNACQFKDNHGPSGTPKGVVLLSSTGNAIANYQLWRLDMTIMQVYLNQAATLGCPASKAPLLGIVDIGQAVTVVQSALQLFANSESALEVTGTIQDQALIDGIARELRNMKVPVLVPDVYTSFSLSLDYTTSPFLSRLVELVRERNCLQASLKGTSENLRKITDATAERDAYLKIRTDAYEKQIDPKLTTAQKKTSTDEIAEIQKKINDLNTELDKLNSSGSQSRINTIQSLTGSIDAFVSSLMGVTPASPNSPSTTGSPAPASSTPAATPSASTNPSPASVAASPSASPPPIVTVLTADGLNRRMENIQAGVKLKDSDWRVLAVKALESGGALITTTNIFGSKVHFSGGAIATYALFGLEGSLECSGNVFDYGGYVRPGQFADRFHRATIEPDKQLLFLRGGCALPDTAKATPLKK